MSRNYENVTTIEGAEIDEAAAREVYEGLWNLERSWPEKGGFSFAGTMQLAGGESEPEAHKRFARAFREEFPGCAVTTVWTYLDDLPCESYFTDAGAEV